MSTIAEIVAASAADTGEFSLLARALETAGLTSVVADPHADLTVFAPTDAAFVALAQSFGLDVDGSDEDAVFNGLVEALSGLGDPVAILTDVLLYHVSPGAQDLHALRDAGSAGTALAGTSVGVAGSELVDNDPEARNPNFVEGLTDIHASNGVIQVIDGVLLPVDVPQAPLADTIADLVVATSGSEGFDGNGGDFDVLREALIATDLLDVVADASADFTVFAPTDQAFVDLARSLGANVAEGDDAAAFEAIFGALVELTGSEEAALAQLETILLNHVAPQGRAVENLQGDVATAAGTTLVVEGDRVMDGDTTLTDASFVSGATDLVTGNGIVQAVDFVLLPGEVAEVRDPLSSELLEGTADNDMLFGAAGDDVVLGLSGDDTLDGGVGHDRVFGGVGDDVLMAGAGDDRLGGNGGHDEVVFTGAVSDYSIMRTTTNLFEVTDLRDIDGNDGRDLIGGVETLRFSDGTLDTSLVFALERGEVLAEDDALAALMSDGQATDATATIDTSALPSAMDMASLVTEPSVDTLV